ncbi:MAG: hypothetical protein KatS3mg115_0271 [Candidatus Poribacteria bacterium]|nr:MAG: hypothetical protein KatS3mg115_0271 [Candidatus Poribacteria bacterium]
MQLRYGSEDPSVRTPNTPEAIARLVARGYLEPSVAQALEEAYRFLRTIEDRLHIADQRPLSALPSDPIQLNKLARRLGYRPSEGRSPADQLLGDYHAQTERVRALFEETFAQLGAKA